MAAFDPSRCTGFDWGRGNVDKSWSRHRVSPFECEQIFFNQPLVVAPDEDHSQTEARFYALGRTDAGRMLFAVFTIRGGLVRVIGARDMSRAEREVYESHEEQGA